MRAVVLQSSYVPWKGYFDLIQSADVFVYYDEVKYTKNDWRNRNRICSKNGVFWLTIPISHTAVKQKISDVTLPDPRWQIDHHKKVYQCYRSARFFHQIEPLLHDFYRATEWKTLSALNRYCIETIAVLLGITTRFLDSQSFDLAGDRVVRLVNLLKQIGATEYLSGPRGREYLQGHEALFADANIRLLFKSYDGYPEYRQLHSPFEPAVSILDVLANVELGHCRRFITAGPAS